MLATDIADYLVARGAPFREAYRVVSRLSEYALEKGVGFDELSLDEYKLHSSLFDESVYGVTVESSIAARDVHGGTAQPRVAKAVAVAKSELEEQRGIR